MDLIVEDALILPHSAAADARYAATVLIRRELRRARLPGSDASDADVWIIANSWEHGLILLSHDRQQVALGRAAGLEVWTNLTRLRDDNPAIR